MTCIKSSSSARVLPQQKSSVKVDPTKIFEIVISPFSSETIHHHSENLVINSQDSLISSCFLVTIILLVSTNPFQNLETFFNSACQDAPMMPIWQNWQNWKWTNPRRAFPRLRSITNACSLGFFVFVTVWTNVASTYITWGTNVG